MLNTTHTHEAEWGSLITQTAQGDQSALATLYDRTSPRVYGLIFKILGNREAATANGRPRTGRRHSRNRRWSRSGSPMSAGPKRRNS